MKQKKTFLIRFAEKILKACRRREVCLYTSKFSKKTYTVHQHIVLLAVREYQGGVGFDRFCEGLFDFQPLLNFLKLEKVPHFSTLHKVSQRLKGSLLEDLFLGFARRAKFRAGMDSTGLSCQYSTHYYEQRLEHFRKSKNKKPGRPKKRRKKKHQYNNLLIDLDAQLVLAVVLLRGSQSDNKKCIPTLNKVKEIHKQINSFDTDKGYDAEYNHEYVVEKVKAEDYIKLRNENVPVRRTRGANRKKAKRKAQKTAGRPRKNHRNKAETVMFVLKKVFGEHLTARKAVNQRQQARFRIIAYNAYRLAKSWLIEGFL